MKKSKKAAALTYDSSKDLAPKVIAKGRGHIAEKILEIADEYKIPMVEDENLVQLLEALDLNAEIPSSLYKTVAEILAFVYRINQSFHDSPPVHRNQ